MEKKNLKIEKGPDFIKYFKPIIEILEELGGSGKPSEVTNLIIERFNITDEELEQKNQNGESTVKNRIAWARFYLAKGNVLDSSKRGIWILKQGYKEFFAKDEYTFFQDVHKQFNKNEKKINKSESRINEEIEEVISDEDYKEDLIELLKNLSPNGFERLCQRLLRESGFTQVKVTGKSGDGGIDGVGTLEINPLLSIKVLFQSKRYKDTVSSDKIRDFRGSLAGRADKGIFITTGRFTKDAQEEAVRDGAAPIELIDGEKLVSLFENLELGLKPRTVYDIDYEFFKEFE